MRGSFLFLGTGASSGVPMVGCKCPVCSSSSVKNKRLRSSALIKVDNKVLLLDVSPDFRQQALNFGIDHIDGLLFTHAHYDHVGGLDDLRIYNLKEKKSINCLASIDTHLEIKRSFYYLFLPVSNERSLSTQLNFQILEKDAGETFFQGIKIKYFSYSQKKMKVTGYIFGDLAYVTDIKSYTEEIFNHLKGINTLIISALRSDPSIVHFNLSDALAFAKKVNAKKTYFNHIAHEVDHEKVSKSLPENIYLSYDSLDLELNYDR